jgi:hypothetical protein
MTLGALQVARYRRASDCYQLQTVLATKLGRPLTHLTPFELALVFNPARCEAACAHIEAATAADVARGEGAAHCETFFAWLTSVREEEKRASTSPSPSEEPLPTVDDELLRANCHMGLRKVEEGVGARRPALGDAAEQALAILDELLPPSSTAQSVPPSGPASPTVGPLSRLQRAVHLKLASVHSREAAGIALLDVDAHLPADLAAAANNTTSHSSTASSDASPAQVSLTHIPEDVVSIVDGGIDGSSAVRVPAADELRKLKQSNLEAAKQLAHLRASAKRTIKQAVASLGSPRDLASQL